NISSAFAVFNSAISPYLYFIFSFDPRKECHELAFHLLRYGGLRCFLGSNDTLNESVMSQTGRTTTGGGGAGRRQSGGNAIRTE
uniref:G_PROTEIN_RECEP_F1_2 domain-containing protein n=1 Tax=Globodera pallida TaxID=36090 RepID=A0A183CSV7_GLOPA